MRINVPKAEENVSTVLCPGRYEIECISVKPGDKYAENGRISIGYVVLDGPMQGKNADVSPNGRKFYEFRVLDQQYGKSDGHIEMIKRQSADMMAAFGFDLSDEGFELADLMNKSAVVKLKVKVWNDEESNEVGKWLPKG